MIRCSHCGKLAPAGAISCQNCGMPLASGGEGMAGAGKSEQQELPAWLESLRAHERPVSSGLGEQPFSMAEVVDENSMPRWMRQDRPRAAESGNSDAFPALTDTPKPGPNTEKQAFPASGLVAGSLIDEQALPSWMRGQEGVQPEAGQRMAANSLVDQQSLPPWIKNLDQTGQPQAPVSEKQYGLPAQNPVTPPSMPNAARIQQAPPARMAYSGSPEAPTQGFSAGELIDQQSLPGWMTGAQGPGPQPPSRPVPTGTGFSAGELIDQRSLPKWIQDQSGQEQEKSASALGMPVGGSGQMSGRQQGVSGNEGMPASTLLDMGSLPAWMREEEQSAQGTQQPGHGMAAGSLVDLNAMPAWLRNTDNPQPPARGGQARAEGTRVPSRPRSDFGMQEQSEVAANVFSSMLGVSASAPVIPGQEQVNNLGVYQGQPAQPIQSSIPGWQSPQPPAGNQGAQPQAWQMSGPMSPAGASPIPSSPMPTGASNMQPRANMTNMSPFTGIAGADRPGARSAVGVGGNSGMETAGTKKKSFFDAIRDFFFK